MQNAQLCAYNNSLHEKHYCSETVRTRASQNAQWCAYNNSLHEKHYCTETVRSRASQNAQWWYNGVLITIVCTLNIIVLKQCALELPKMHSGGTMVCL